jgi:hypothetical protein
MLRPSLRRGRWSPRADQALDRARSHADDVRASLPGASTWRPVSDDDHRIPDYHDRHRDDDEHEHADRDVSDDDEPRYPELRRSSRPLWISMPVRTSVRRLGERPVRLHGTGPLRRDIQDVWRRVSRGTHLHAIRSAARVPKHRVRLPVARYRSLFTMTARNRTLPSATRSYALFTSASEYVSVTTFTFPFAT